MANIISLLRKQKYHFHEVKISLCPRHNITKPSVNMDSND